MVTQSELRARTLQQTRQAQLRSATQQQTLARKEEARAEAARLAEVRKQEAIQEEARKKQEAIIKEQKRIQDIKEGALAKIKKKAAGRRIGSFDSEEEKKEFERLASIPEIREALDVGAELKGKALKAGFKDVGEFVAVSQFLAKPPELKKEVKTEVIEPTRVVGVDKPSKIQEVTIPAKVVGLPPTIRQLQKEKGFISGTFDWLGEKSYSATLKGQLKQEQKAVERGDYLDLYYSRPRETAKISSFVAQTSPYLNPAGALILLAKGTESYVTKPGREQIKLKETQLKVGGVDPTKAKIIAYGTPAIEVGLGAFGVKTQLKAIQLKRAVTPPKQVVGETEVFFGTKLKTQVTPKPKQITSVVGETTGITRGSTITQREITAPITRTITRGKRYLDIQYVDPTGAVRGTTIRTSPLGKFGKTFVTESRISPKGIGKYKVYRDGKLVKQFEAPVKSSFGFTEPVQVSKVAKTKTITTPDKVKIRTIKEQRLFEQKFVKTGKDKFDVESGKQFTTIKTAREIKATPLEEQIFVRGRTPSKELDLSYTLQTKPAKFVKKGSVPSDLSKIKDVQFTPEGRFITSREFKTPKIEELSVQTGVSRGQFILRRKTAGEKFVEKTILGTGKKGQVSLTPQRLDFLRQVKVPATQVKTPDIATKFFLPPRITTPTRTGLSSLGGLTSLERTRQVPIQFTSPTTTPSLTSIQQPAQIETTIPRISSIQQPISIQREVQVPKTIQTTKQITPQKQRPIQRQSPLRAQTQRPPRQRIRTKIPIPLPITPPAFKSKVVETSEGMGKYQAFVRRFGRDIQIGTFKSKEKAKQKLLETLKDTLGASGFLQKKGKKVSPEEFGVLPFQFRQAKKEPSRVVQKRKFRLGTRSEVGEIQMFKKKSKKKSKKKRLFF